MALGDSLSLRSGLDAEWSEGWLKETQDAPVPGIIQQVFPAYHGVAWYWHSFRELLQMLTAATGKLALAWLAMRGVKEKKIEQAV